jgi:hypothetical protein
MNYLRLKNKTPKRFAQSALVYHSVTNNLTNCGISNSATQAEDNTGYTANITGGNFGDDYGMINAPVTVTMGGTDITATAYTAPHGNIMYGVVNIAAVTGDVVITASGTVWTYIQAMLFVWDNFGWAQFYSQYSGYIDDTGGLANALNNGYLITAGNGLYFTITINTKTYKINSATVAA